MAVDVPDWLRLTQLAAPNPLGSITVPAANAQVTQAFPVSPFATGIVVLPLFLLANPVVGVQIEGNTSGALYVNVAIPAGFIAMPPLFAVNVQPIDSTLNVTVSLHGNAGAGGQMVAYVFELFGTGIEQVSNNFVQPLYVTVVPPPTTAVNPFALSCAAASIGVVVGGATSIIAGVAGEVITVYGYDYVLRPNGAAAPGVWRLTVEDSTAAIQVAEADLIIATAVGVVTQPHQLSMPQGIALPAGAGLQAANSALSTNALAVTGAFFYTQF